MKRDLAFTLGSMKKLVVFDDQMRSAFLPLVWSKCIGELEVGKWSLGQRWALALGLEWQALGPKYLSKQAVPDEALFVNARLIPEDQLLVQLNALASNEWLTDADGQVAAFYGKSENFLRHYDREQGSFENVGISHPELKSKWLNAVTDIFALCEDFISWDCKQKTPQQIDLPDWVQVIGPRDRLFVEEGVELLPCTINTSTGPVWISKGAVIMEQVSLRGPITIGVKTQIKMGAKIYGPSSFGRECRVGGEVSNSVFFSYTNKGHDGFVGNSVLGSWCNLGADTNTSNLKNNYSPVKRWSYNTEKMEDSGTIFCGLIMGDHSKCSINSMFNTGTTVGFGCSIFGSGFPSKFVPSFTWGGCQESETYGLDKMIQTAELVMQRRKVTLSDSEKDKLRHIFSLTSAFRTY